MTAPTVIAEPAWLAWYKEQLPKAAKSATRLRRNLTGCRAVLIASPAFGAGVLALVILSVEPNAPIGLLLLIAGVSGVAYAAGNVGVIRLLRLDRFVVRWVVVRVLLFLAAINAIDGLLNFAQIGMGLRIPNPFQTDHAATPADAAVLFLVCVEIMLGQAFLFIYLDHRYGSFKRSLESSQLLPIERSPDSSLWTLVSHVLADARQLGLPKIRLSLWLLRIDDSPLPSLFAIGDGESTEYRLIVPRPFFNLVLVQHPARATAMLAHELSHAFQRDVELWSRSDLFYVVLARVLAPQLMVLGAALGLLSLISGNFGAAAGALAWVYMSRSLFHARSSIRNARRDSEYVADLFASYTTSHQDTLESIRIYTDDASPLHPSQSDRLEHLARMHAKFD